MLRVLKRVRQKPHFVTDDLIFKKDNLSGGYIAYYKNVKGVIGQGLTRPAALVSLKEDLQLVAELRNRNSYSSAIGD